MPQNPYLEALSGGQARNQQLLVELMKLKQNQNQFDAQLSFREKDLAVEKQRTEQAAKQNERTNARLDKAEARAESAAKRAEIQWNKDYAARIGKLEAEGLVVSDPNGDVDLGENRKGRFATPQEMSLRQGKDLVDKRFAIIDGIQERAGVKIPQDAQEMYVLNGYLPQEAKDNAAGVILKDLTAEADAKGLSGAKRRNFISRGMGAFNNLSKPAKERDDNDLKSIGLGIMNEARATSEAYTPEDLFGTFEAKKVSKPGDEPGGFTGGKEERFMIDVEQIVADRKDLSPSQKNIIVEQIRARITEGKTDYINELVRQQLLGGSSDPFSIENMQKFKEFLEP